VIDLLVEGEAERGNCVRHSGVMNAGDRGVRTGRGNDDQHHAEQHCPHRHPVGAESRPLVRPGLAPARGAIGRSAHAAALGALAPDRHGAATGNAGAADPRLGAAPIRSRAGRVWTLAANRFLSVH